MEQTTPAVSAVVDSSFWINAVRAGVAPYLTHYFSLAIAPGTARELKALLDQPQPPEAALLFQDWQDRGLIHVVAPEQEASRPAGQSSTDQDPAGCTGRAITTCLIGTSLTSLNSFLPTVYAPLTHRLL